MVTEPLDHQRVFANPAFMPWLKHNGLDTFAGVMALSGGNMMRSVPGRSTVQIELRQPNGGMQVAYLKRYEANYLKPLDRLKRLLHWPGADDEAAHEWRMINLLRDAGFNTPMPIACGQFKSGGIVTRSFLLTAEIAGGEAAHECLRTFKTKPRERRSFLREVGTVSQQFHGAGFVHKDFYLSHLFVAPGAKPGTRAFYFIDLQRLARPRLLNRRWRIKDAAQLAYSAHLDGASHADLLACYLAYADKKRLDSEDRRWIRDVWKRVRGLQNRGPKYDVIWDKPGVRPRNV